jgi:hypothetical protein
LTSTVAQAQRTPVKVALIASVIGIEGGISRADARRAVAGVRVRAGPGAEVGASSKAFDPNALARAAIDAVVGVARVQGVRLSAPRIPPPAPRTTADPGSLPSSPRRSSARPQWARPWPSFDDDAVPDPG